MVISRAQSMLFTILLLIVLCCSILPASGWALTSTKRTIPDEVTLNNKLHPLLKEIDLSDRFSQSYRLVEIGYGEEYTLEHDGWSDFLAEYGPGWRVMWDSRAGRHRLIEGHGIPFYSGKGNYLEDTREVTLELLHERILLFCQDHIGLLRLDFSTLELNQEGSHIFDKGRYAVMQYDYFLTEQTSSGELRVPVLGGRVFFRFNNGNLVQFGCLNICDHNISLQPSLLETNAEDIITEVFHGRNGELSTIHQVELKGVPEIPEETPRSEVYSGPEGLGLHYRLVWSISFSRGSVLDDYEAWVDAHSGYIVFLNRLSSSGHVYGGVTMAPGDQRTKMLLYAAINNNGSTWSTLFGHYYYSSIPSTLASTSLDGLYFSIDDHCGALSLSTTTSPGNLYLGYTGGTDCDTPGFGGAGNTYPSRNAFWHNNIIRKTAYFYLSSNTWLTSDVEIFTNRVEADYICNAGWSPTLGTLNYFVSGVVEGCRNSAEVPGIMYHEWGHGLDDNDGSPSHTPPSEESTSEAYADSMAVIMDRDPCGGNGLYYSFDNDNCWNCPTDCLGVRYIGMRFDHDNNASTPEVPVTPQNIENANGPDCSHFVDPRCDACPYSYWDDEFSMCFESSYNGVLGYQAHCESYIASGAVYDMLESIAAVKGDAGRIWVQRMWFEAVSSLGSAYRISSGIDCDTSSVDGCDATNWYTVLLGIDDDDGNLTNGTPNGGRIWTAFNNHGIACGSQPSNYNVCDEPSTPTLYAARSDGQISFSWTPVTNATGYRLYVNEYATAGDCEQGAWMPYLTYSNYTYTTVYNLLNGYSHAFAVQAINGSDDCVSSLSNCVYVSPTSSALVNLTGIKTSGWDYTVVPSDDTCSAGTCHRSATLSANGYSSNISFKVRNNSSEAAGSAYDSGLYIDDNPIVFFTQPTHAANTTIETLNYSLSVKGGRHILRLEIDDYNDLSESIETDNTWIAPFVVYEPYDLDDDGDHMTQRSSPPDRDPQGYNYYSCDGYQFSVVTGINEHYWGGVGMIPSSNTADYDVRLHGDYTGSTQGFGSNYRWSNSGANGEVEIVGINRNQSSTETWWAGIIQGNSTPGSATYCIHRALSGSPVLIPSSGTTGSIPGGGVLAIEEIHPITVNLPITWTITVTPSGGDIAIALIDASMEYFRLSDADPIVNNAGVDGIEQFELLFPSTGYYGLLIYKPDYTQLNDNISYILDITETPSNLEPFLGSGWDDIIVPRNTTGCLVGSCPLTATLPGWTGVTYVNASNINNGPNDITTSFDLRYTLDDIPLDELTIPSLDAYTSIYNINHAIVSGPINGGRHTIGTFIDANLAYLESDEGDNKYFQQFIWSPQTLTDQIPFITAEPPDRNTTGYVYYNCDGFEFDVIPESGQKYWGVVGMLPLETDDDYDLRLHSDYTGSTGGFGSSLRWSNNGSTGGLELVGVNRNVATDKTWWTGVIQGTNSPSTGDYTICKTSSGNYLTVPTSPVIGNIPVNGVVNIEEIYFNPGSVGTSWRVLVTPLGGDIGIALIDRTLAYFDLDDALTGTIINGGGLDKAEYFDFTPSAQGFYGLLIYKPDWTMAANSIDYTVEIFTLTSSIAETPDGFFISGTPLTIQKSGSDLDLSWGHSCDQVPGVTHYAIYRGELASLTGGSYNHSALICDSGTDNSETVSNGTTDYYFLVVPTDNTNEGGYGFDSSGSPRPTAGSACFSQNRGPCP